MVLMSGIFDGCCFILSGGQLLKRSIIAAGLLFASSTKYTKQVASNIFRQRGKVLHKLNVPDFNCYKLKRLIKIPDL